MDSEGEETVRKVLKALIISSPNGLTVKQLLKDYEDMVGTGIPFENLGHPTPLNYLQHIPDILQVRGNGLQALVVPVTNSKTAHLEEMIQKQKKPAKKSRHHSGPVLNRPNAVTQNTPKSKKKKKLQVMTPKTVNKFNDIMMEFNSGNARVKSSPKSQGKGGSKSGSPPQSRVANFLSEAALQMVEDVIVRVVENCVHHFLEEKFQHIKSELTEMVPRELEPLMGRESAPKRRKMNDNNQNNYYNNERPSMGQQLEQNLWHYSNYYNNDRFAYNRNMNGGNNRNNEWFNERFGGYNMNQNQYRPNNNYYNGGFQRCFSNYRNW